MTNILYVFIYKGMVKIAVACVQMVPIMISIYNNMNYIKQNK